jgi:predicted nucleic acid-binding protein
MIIIDTSIWIEFFRGNKLYFSDVKKLLENQKILAIDVIFAELLQGVKSNKEIEIIIKYWENLPKIIQAEMVIEAGIYSAKNKLTDKGIGLIDSIIIIAALKTKSKIWTLDKKLLKVLDNNIIFTLNTYS